jgi:hypothetical protein
MKLTLSHADVTLALCEFLAARGMTAFDPSKVTADFAFKRGSKELLCELDTEPKAPVEVAPVAAKAAAVAKEVPVETVADAVADAGVAVAAEEAGVAVAGTEAVAGDDNLFD